MDKRDQLELYRREWMWRKCRQDEKFALKHFWNIKHPTGRMAFDLRPSQEYALDHWAKNDMSITLKARQIGWSTVVASHAWWLTYFFPDREIIMISKGEREAQKLLQMAKYGLKFLPQWMQQRGPSIVRDTAEMLLFSNDSSIESAPSAQDPARGRTAYLVILDEWASLPDAENGWASIKPVADIGGRIIGLSTAKGYGNFFHQMWVDAETGNNDFSTMFQPYSVVPERDENWYEKESRNTLPWIMAQEYPRNPAEAFIKSGNPVFDIELLMEMEKHVALPKIGYLGEVP